MNVDVIITELEIESVLMRRHYHRIMDDLQERFGPCHPHKACKVVGIDFQDRCRATPVDGGVVITLTHRSAWLPCALFEFAHECLHTLDPSLEGEASVLEEGLAREYQLDYARSWMPNFPTPPPAPEDEEAGRLAMPAYLASAGIRRLRATGLTLQNIPAKALGQEYPAIPGGRLRTLCSNFKTWKIPRAIGQARDTVESLPRV